MGPTSSTTGLPDPDGGSPGASTLDDGWGSSGGVEDTLFGMSDDMPLVADIPDIKQGLLDVTTWVRIEQIRPISGRAEFGRDAWFYVQDPAFQEYMALRVLLQPGDAMPSPDRMVDLEGWLLTDAQGWLLQLDSAVEGSVSLALPPRQVPVSTLLAADAAALDDALVEVSEPSGLVVRRRGIVSGTLLVGAAASSGAVIVDLRPFGLQLDLPPGTQLSRLRGVAEIDGSRPVILPRRASDLVVAQ